MKPLFTVFIFTIFLEIKRTYGSQEIGGVLIDLDENRNELGNTFRKAYGDHILEISGLGSEQIASMIPRLEAVVKAAEGNPLATIFDYVKELCAERAKFESLNKVTNNIGDFVAASGGYGGGERKSAKRGAKSQSDSPLKVFSATSVVKDNGEQIKATFDDVDPNFKKDNALKDQDEKLKRAEKERGEAMGRAEADLKKAEDDYQVAAQRVEREHETAYAAAADICQNGIKKSEEDEAAAEKEYDDAKRKADEMRRQADDDYETATKAAEEDYEAALQMAEENLEDAEADYEAAVAKGRKQHADATKRADARRQTAADQYEAALNGGRMTEKIRNAIEKTANKAEVAYQQALNRANSELDRVEADALKEWTMAQREYEEAKRIAENEANVAYVEAQKLKEKASEEQDKILGSAQTELYKKQQSAEARKQRACQEERYDAEAKADKAQDEATRRLKKQWAEVQNLAEQNLERIEQEYREKIETITREYHDAWNEADALEEEMEKVLTSQNKASGKSAKNTGKNNRAAERKKRPQKSRNEEKTRRGRRANDDRS